MAHAPVRVALTAEGKTIGLEPKTDVSVSVKIGIATERTAGTEATAPTPEGSFTKSLHDGSVTLASLSEELLAGFLGEEAPAADDGAWDADW